MITYAGEGTPEILALTTPDGATANVLCWPTRVPGLVVAARPGCGHFALYAQGLTAFVGPCFPIKLCAAAFAILLAARTRAPWGASPEAVRSAADRLDWTALNRSSAVIGGETHHTNA